MQKAIKKPNSFKCYILDNPQLIRTTIDGKEETVKSADKGDYLITGTQNEQYAISPDKFNARYTYDIENKIAITKPVEIEYVKLEKEVEIIAEFEEKQFIPSGGVIVFKSNGESTFYGIHPKSFKETYEIRNK